MTQADLLTGRILKEFSIIRIQMKKDVSFWRIIVARQTMEESFERKFTVLKSTCSFEIPTQEALIDTARDGEDITKDEEARLAFPELYDPTFNNNQEKDGHFQIDYYLNKIAKKH